MLPVYGKSCFIIIWLLGQSFYYKVNTLTLHRIFSTHQRLGPYLEPRSYCDCMYCGAPPPGAGYVISLQLECYQSVFHGRWRACHFQILPTHLRRPQAKASENTSASESLSTCCFLPTTICLSSLCVIFMSSIFIVTVSHCYKMLNNLDSCSSTGLPDHIHTAAYRGCPYSSSERFL